MLTEERTKFLYYPDEPVSLDQPVIVARKGSGMKVGSLDDLKGKTVAVVRGYEHSEEFTNCQGIRKTECNDDEEMIRMLAKGRVSLALCADEVGMRRHV